MSYDILLVSFINRLEVQVLTVFLLINNRLFKAQNWQYPLLMISAIGVQVFSSFRHRVNTRAKVFDFDLIFHQRPGQRRNKLPGGNGPEMSSYDRAVGGPQRSLSTTEQSSVVGEWERYPPETITVMSPD